LLSQHNTRPEREIMEKCLQCQKEFEPDGSALRRRKTGKSKSLNEGKFCSRTCGAQYNKLSKIIIHKPNSTCSYCNKKFYIQPSHKTKSKSGLYFCCREHKDLAQRIEFDLQEIWPDHYNNGNSSSREILLRNKNNKCELCGFDKLEILQVHHIDLNRKNNKLENLQLLCPNCHYTVHFNTKTGMFHFMK
jgi:5-methylcytosine-specific restriction endonuclease McrA